MNKITLKIIILFFSIFQVYGQPSYNIQSYYGDFISFQKYSHNDKNYIIKKIVKTDKKSYFSDIINNNPMFIDYLLTNFSTANFQKYSELTDSIAIKNSCLNELKKDSLFNAVMTNLIRKTTDKKTLKDTISMDNLLNIAVKFFAILKLTDEGHYIGKICVGLNIIRSTESERKPFIEAFAFASIMKHLDSQEYNMYNEFVKAIKELYKVNLGIDKNEKLLRAQGAMFLLMRNNPTLHLMLKNEYQKQKEYLPFVLKD